MKKYILILATSVVALTFAACGNENKKEEMSVSQVWQNMEQANSLDNIFSSYKSIEINDSYTSEGHTTSEVRYISPKMYCLYNQNSNALLYMDATSGFNYAADDEKFVYIIDDVKSYQTLYNSSKSIDLGISENISFDKENKNTIVKNCDATLVYYVYDPNTFLLQERYTILKADGTENVHMTYTYNKDEKDDDYSDLADEFWDEYASSKLVEITLTRIDGTSTNYEVPEGWMITPIIPNKCKVIYESDGSDYFYDPVQNGDVFVIQEMVSN